RLGDVTTAAGPQFGYLAPEGVEVSRERLFAEFQDAGLLAYLAVAEGDQADAGVEVGLVAQAFREVADAVAHAVDGELHARGYVEHEDDVGLGLLGWPRHQRGQRDLAEEEGPKQAAHGAPDAEVERLAPGGREPFERPIYGPADGVEAVGPTRHVVSPSGGFL